MESNAIFQFKLLPVGSKRQKLSVLRHLGTWIRKNLRAMMPEDRDRERERDDHCDYYDYY